MTDERQIIVEVRAGNRELFGELVRAYQARLRAYVAQFVENSHDVYDIVQDAFLDALRNLAAFDESREFYPWMRAVCRNRMLNTLRSRRRSAAVALVDDAVADLASLQGDGEEAEERVAALKQCIEKLEANQRALLGQRYTEGIPVKELASRMRRSAASISMQLYRLRSILLECVSKHLQLVQP